MKTIIDAVNELKSDLINQDNNCVFPEHRLLIRMLGKLTLTATRKDAFMKNHNQKGCINYVCTIEEFNDLVTELSHASWIKGASLAEYQAADKEALTVENKTVEVDGMIYEIGKLYEFSDSLNDIDWFQSKLSGTSKFAKLIFVDTNLDEWRFCRVVTALAGTITPAPAKLVDGAAYEFDVKNIIHIGFYRNKRKSFFTALSNSGNKICGEAEAKNITRLVPEAK